MAAPARPSTIPFPDDHTIAGYQSDGRWDCGHAFGPGDFADAIDLALKARPGAPQGGVGVVNAVWTNAFMDDIFDDWAVQNDLDGHPRAREAFDAWATGWKSCAAHKLGEIIKERWEEIFNNADLFFLTDEDGNELDRFDNIDEAIEVLARMPVESRIEMEDGDEQRALLGWINPELDKTTMELSTYFSVPEGRWGASKERKAIALAISKFPALREAAKGYFRLNPAMNPAWITRTLAHTLETIEHGIPPQWMPKQDAVRSRGSTLISKVTEYGCGAYGCALPTLDPKIVLKVTTDDTEAQFAEKLAKTLVAPVCVKYEAVLKTNMTHQGRPITLLWREEARDIGKLAGKSEDLVADQHAAAQDAFELIVDGQTGAEVRAALANWERKVDAMKRSAELEWLARGMLRVYREQGVFFGDIHAGNLGKCPREGTLRWVITDPGHIAVVQR